ncbi:MAG: hypothetical protein AAFV88_05545 [Planctomycetota bacterium]
MSGHNVAIELSQAEFELADPGNAGSIPSPNINGGVLPLVTAAAETRALENPERAGIVMTLCFRTDGGDCVVTAASAVNQAGNNTLTLADAGDEITLRSIRSGDTFVWRVASNDGVALSTV